MKVSEVLVTAAGGNGTAIEVINEPLTRAQYEERGKALCERMDPLGAEQAGFLVLQENHFEMAGGEFCGNATRSAAVLLSEETGSEILSFTVSGFDGNVSATVAKQPSGDYDVSCTFPGIPTDVRNVTLEDGQHAAIVDLGGIVHVVIEAEFPENSEAYEAAHKAITQKFNLSGRDAVGVVWYQKTGDEVTMHPVVWVRAVDTFYYETSCGSGTIAVGRVTGLSSIIQPTEKIISVHITEGTVTLQSEMEVVR